MVIYLWLVCVFCKENFLFDNAKVTNFFLGPQKFKIPYLTLVQRFIPKLTLPSTLLVYSVNPWVNHVRFYVNGLNWPQLWKRKRSPMLSPQSLIVIVTPLTPVLIPLQTLDQVLRRLQTAAMQGDAATRGCTAHSQPRVAGQWPCKATWTRTGPDTQQRGHARGRPRMCRHTNWESGILFLQMVFPCAGKHVVHYTTPHIIWKCRHTLLPSENLSTYWHTIVNETESHC